MNMILTILAVICLIYAGYLFKKKDKNYVYPCVIGLILLISCYTITADKKIEAYKTSLKNLNTVLQNLGGSFPASVSSGTLQCLEAADDTAKINLSNTIKTALDNIKNGMSELKTAYEQLPVTEQTARQSEYKTISDKASVFFTIDKTGVVSINSDKYSSDINNIKWNGIRPCIDICTLNKTPAASAATYKAGGNCSCPYRYFPTIQRNYNTNNDNIKCEEVDYSANFNAFNSNKNLVDLSIIPPPNQIIPLTLNYQCGAGTPCPTKASLVRERTPVLTTCTLSFSRANSTTPSPLPITLSVTSTKGQEFLYIKSSCSLLPRIIRVTMSGTATKTTLAIFPSNTLVNSTLSVTPSSTAVTYDIPYPPSESVPTTDFTLRVNTELGQFGSSIPGDFTFTNIQILV